MAQGKASVSVNFSKGKDASKLVQLEKVIGTKTCSPNDEDGEISIVHGTRFCTCIYLFWPLLPGHAFLMTKVYFYFKIKKFFSHEKYSQKTLVIINCCLRLVVCIFKIFCEMLVNFLHY